MSGPRPLYWRMPSTEPIPTDTPKKRVYEPGEYGKKAAQVTGAIVLGPLGCGGSGEVLAPASGFLFSPV